MRFRRWSGEISPRLRKLWAAHSRLLLLIGVVILAIGTPLRLFRVLPDLLWDAGLGSARDLKLRYLEVQTWFAGLPVYGAVDSADYPPGSYSILWLSLGWGPFTTARRLWAVVILAGLGYLAYVCVRAVKTETPSLRWFVALLPFCVYPTTAAIVQGQLTIHTLAPLVGGLLLLRQGSGRWWEDALAAGLFIAALVKPTISAPFFWLVLFMPGRLRPGMLVLLGYAALTLVAASFQEASLPELFQAWRAQESQIAMKDGHANLSKWLVLAGSKELIAPAALLALFGIGVWTWRRRGVDFWLLMGVVGLASRLWIHHRGQDDLLMLAPMIALLRLTKSSPAADGSDVTAGLLFALICMTMLAPVDLLVRIPVLKLPMEIWLGALWVTTLLFLLRHAKRDRGAGLPAGESVKPSEVAAPV